ncbi:MAG: hypothetical protein QFB86_01780 [Patescibacteria group bacterium]|nr:hypothetical protein [Patescibacteria group bacterium]
MQQKQDKPNSTLYLIENMLFVVLLVMLLSGVGMLATHRALRIGGESNKVSAPLIDSQKNYMKPLPKDFK